MKIQFNWGTGIFIVIILFVGLFVSFIIFSLSLDINLVSTDYYAKEVAYESQIQKIKNTANLSQKVEIEKSGTELRFLFPEMIKEKKFSAIVRLFCYTDRHKDSTFSIRVDTAFRATADCKSIKKGRYAVKLEWKADSSAYYQEKDVIFE